MFASIKHSFSLTFVFCAVFFLIFAFNPITGRAELGGVESFIFIRVTPEQPKAGDEVLISLETTATDLNRADIRWIRNGKTEERGIGKKSFVFGVGGNGSNNRIEALVATAEGELARKIVEIAPSEVDLIWQADSYVPPFYLGKALFPRQGTVRVAAIPHILNPSGYPIRPSDLVYNWKKDSKAYADMSGYGKDTFLFTGDIFSSPTRIEVTVNTVDGKKSASSETTITPVNSRVIFYEYNPIYGTMYEKNLTGAGVQSQQEITLVGMPYFFSRRSFANGLISWTWSMNGKIMDAAGNKIILRKIGGESGSSRVGLSTENRSEFLQTSETVANILLNDNPSENPFNSSSK